jgi:hypothetical protein
MTLILVVNWEAISAIGQIVGAIAVVISLIYVAREVRSSAHATQLASRHSMEDIFIRWAQQLADNQNLRELYYRGLHDFESLEGADLVGFGILIQGLFRLDSARKPIIDTWRGIWMHACGMGGKRP